MEIRLNTSRIIYLEVWIWGLFTNDCCPIFHFFSLTRSLVNTKKKDKPGDKLQFEITVTLKKKKIVSQCAGFLICRSENWGRLIFFPRYATRKGTKRKSCSNSTSHCVFFPFFYETQLFCSSSAVLRHLFSFYSGFYLTLKLDYSQPRACPHQSTWCPDWCRPFLFYISCTFKQMLSLNVRELTKELVRRRF